MNPTDELRIRPMEGHHANGNSYSLDMAKQVVVRLLAQGMTLHEAAIHIGRPYPTVANWMRNFELGGRLKELNQEAFARLDVEIRQLAETTNKRIIGASDSAL